MVSAKTSDDLSVWLLGHFRVTVGQRMVDESAWSSRKARNVIKLLALAPTHRLHRLQLIDFLWPELEPEAAANNLHKVLYVVRHALEPQLARKQRSSFLQLRDDLLFLTAPGSLRVDWESFQTAANAARETRDVGMYQDVLGRYSEELLPEDRYEDWALTRRDRHEQIILTLLLELADLREQQGDPEGAVEVLRKAVEKDPGHEEAHVTLMRLLSDMGHRHQALRQYQQLRNALHREFDTEPSPSADESYRQIANGQVAASSSETHAAVSQPGPSVRVRTELDTTPLVGREHELDTFDSMLDMLLGGQGGLVLLEGEAGIGKSRLATELSIRAGRRAVVVLRGSAADRQDGQICRPFATALEEFATRVDSAYLRSLLDGSASELGRLVPSLSHVLGREQPEASVPLDQQRVVHAVSLFLAHLAAHAPTVLVLDDLHDADAVTLQSLQHLAESGRNSSVLILGLFRQQDVSPRSGFEALLSRLEQKGLTQILRLPAISLDETERLITHLLGGPVERPVVRYIHTVAGGNPHYVCEATRALLGRNHLRREDDLWRLQTEMFVLRDRNDLRGRRGDSGDAQVPGNRGIMREIGTDYQRTLKSEDSRGRMRGDLTDQQWERVRSLLPPQKPRQGRPAKDHRRIVNGILWLNRTGGPWRNLPEEYGPWQTVATRFYRWHKAGVWDHILQALEWGDVADRLGSTGPDRSDTAATG